MMIGRWGTSIFYRYSFIASSAEGASCVSRISDLVNWTFQNMCPQGRVRALFESCLGFHRGYGSSVEDGMALSEHPEASLVALSSVFTHHVSRTPLTCNVYGGASVDPQNTEIFDATVVVFVL